LTGHCGKSVANHRTGLMTKTRASNAAELARLYTIAGTGIIDPAE
jgi:DNA-binding CsgD family transcriptional regulator